MYGLLADFSKKNSRILADRLPKHSPLAARNTQPLTAHQNAPQFKGNLGGLTLRDLTFAGHGGWTA